MPYTQQTRLNSYTCSDYVVLLFFQSATTISSGFIGITLQGVLGWHGLYLLAGGMGTAGN